MSGIHPRLASINFAVIVLSKTIDIGRDHLIHRKRSPFPYEGKALTPDKVGVTFPGGRNLAGRQRFARRIFGRPASIMLSGLRSLGLFSNSSLPTPNSSLLTLHSPLSTLSCNSPPRKSRQFPVKVVNLY